MMKIYRLTKPKDYKGLFKVSLVQDPAIESNLMAFDEEKPEFHFMDDDQRIIYSPALIPNKLIFRKNIEGSPAQVYFDAETIKELHIDGCRNNYDSKVNLNHDGVDTDGIICFESWIIESETQDKAFKLGFDLPIGTLIKGYKIDNQEVWNEIKSGNLKGLSIEAQLFPEEQKVNFKKEDMNKKSIWAKAVELFKAEFKFADMTDYGNGFFGSSLEIGAIVTDKDGNPMADSEFEYDGNKYKTDEMGAISEVEPIEAAAEDSSNTELDDAKAKITELETTIADLQAKLTEAEAMKMANEEAEVKLKADFETAKTELEKAKSENVTMSEEIVNLKKIKSIPAESNKPYEQMTNAEKVKFNRENKY